MFEFKLKDMNDKEDHYRTLRHLTSDEIEKECYNDLIKHIFNTKDESQRHLFDKEYKEITIKYIRD